MATLKHTPAPRPKTVAAMQPSPRHFWLAVLGALVAARRESSIIAQRVTAGVKAKLP